MFTVPFRVPVPVAVSGVALLVKNVLSVPELELLKLPFTINVPGALAVPMFNVPVLVRVVAVAVLALLLIVPATVAVPALVKIVGSAIASAPV